MDVNWTVVGLVVLIAGEAWLLVRRIDQVHRRLEARIDRLTDKVDALRDG